MSGDSLQPARYRAQHLSRDPRRLESGLFSPASANKDQRWRLNKYACAALGTFLCAEHELKRPTGNVKQRMRRKGSSRSATEVCSDARGSHGPINQRRLEAQRALEYVLRIGRLARLERTREQVVKKRHDRHREALRMQPAHLLDVAKARDGLG